MRWCSLFFRVPPKAWRVLLLDSSPASSMNCTILTFQHCDAWTWTPSRINSPTSTRDTPPIAREVIKKLHVPTDILMYMYMYPASLLHACSYTRVPLAFLDSFLILFVTLSLLTLRVGDFITARSTLRPKKPYLHCAVSYRVIIIQE